MSAARTVHKAVLALAVQTDQRQDSLYDQIVDVLTLAREAGCYDAYDWIADRFAASDWSLIDGHLSPPVVTESDPANVP